MCRLPVTARGTGSDWLRPLLTSRAAGGAIINTGTQSRGFSSRRRSEQHIIYEQPYMSLYMYVLSYMSIYIYVYIYINIIYTHIDI